ncbi:MAG: hypothetical protein ABI867_40585 [Kofleriaceae bacterium]
MTNVPDWSRLEAMASTDADAARYEGDLATNPDDAETRVKLIAHYANAPFELRPRMTPHILWMLDHHPLVHLEAYTLFYAALDPEGFVAIRARWVRLLDGCSDPRWFARAAEFLRTDDPELAHQWIDRAVELAPDDWRWRAARASSFERRVRAHPDAARAAFADRDAALQRVTSVGDRYECLIEVASAARVLADWERARTAATAVLVLASDPAVVGRFQHGIGVHVAHSILGQVALHANDVALAVDHLRTSGAWPKSPPFRPEQALAAALFERGQLAVVRWYIDACERFVGAAIAEGWRQLLAAGENPLAISLSEMQLRLRVAAG